MSAFLGVDDHFYGVIYLCGSSVIECIGACMCALLRLRTTLFTISVFTTIIIASHGLLRVVRPSKDNLMSAEHRIELLNLLNLTSMVIYCHRSRYSLVLHILIANPGSDVGTIFL